MPWPTPQDYNEALQLPENFDDPDLRNGTPELNSIGLPKPITGSFASVYQIHSNGKDWAVKCFLRNVPGQMERYAQIGQFVHSDDLPYTIDFVYMDKGLRVHGAWYPILKMDWVYGPTLMQYLTDNVGRPGKLEALAERFQIMTGRLHDEGIAHGDLQHGNMLIVDDEIILVDYDGMYVPSLKGEFSNELGHRNYQHPKRCDNDFGPDLDNFSEWSIYTSLRCLARDPELWLELGASDDCLLFKQRDYAQPENSRVFATLEYHKDEEIRALAKNFRLCLHKPIAEVPRLHTIFDEVSKLPPVAVPNLASSVQQPRTISIEEVGLPREVQVGVAVADEGVTLVVSDVETDEKMLPAQIVVPTDFIVTRPRPPIRPESNNGADTASYDGNVIVSPKAKPSSQDYNISAFAANHPIVTIWLIFAALLALVQIRPPQFHQSKDAYDFQILTTLRIADNQLSQDKYADAAVTYKAAIAQAYSAYGASNPRTARITMEYANCELQLKNYQDAINSAETAARTYADSYGYGTRSPEYADCQLIAATALLEQKKYVDAGMRFVDQYKLIFDAMPEALANSRVVEQKPQFLNGIYVCTLNTMGKTQEEKEFLDAARQILTDANFKPPGPLAPAPETVAPSP